MARLLRRPDLRPAPARDRHTDDFRGGRADLLSPAPVAHIVLQAVLSLRARRRQSRSVAQAARDPLCDVSDYSAADLIPRLALQPKYMAAVFPRRVHLSAPAL